MNAGYLIFRFITNIYKELLGSSFVEEVMFRKTRDNRADRSKRIRILSIALLFSLLFVKKDQIDYAISLLKQAFEYVKTKE